MRDYYNVAAHPSSNYNIGRSPPTKGLAGSREGASHRGLGNDKYFADLEHKALAAALGKCSDIRDVLEGDNDPTNQVQQLRALVAGELENLKVALSGRPLLPAT
jgi:hypothetical protein